MSGVSTLKVVKHKLTIAGKVVHTLNGGRQGPPGPAGPAVAGGDKQVIFNDAGVSAGDSGLTYDKTTGVLTVGGKTVTANAPALQVAQTWNNAAVAFTGAVFNFTDLASAAGSKLLDLQAGGVSKFAVQKNGALLQSLLFAADNAYSIGSQNANRPGSVNAAARLYSAGDLCVGSGGANVYASFAGVGLASGAFVAWSGSSSTDGSTTKDLVLLRGGAGILEQRNGANAQTFRLYEAFTDTANYSRLNFTYGGGFFTIGTQAAGTGTARGLVLNAAGNGLYLDTAGVDRWLLTASGHWNAAAHNTYDFGSAVAAARTGYFGTSVVVPTVAATNVSATAGMSAQTMTVTGAASGIVVNRRDNSAQAWQTYSSAGNLQFFNFPNSADRMALTPSGDLSAAGTVKTGSYTVATLPSVGDGARAIVTDATQTFTSANLGAAPTGGGTNKVPVIAFGGTWVIG